MEERNLSREEEEEHKRNDHANRRQNGGINQRKVYPCLFCNQVMETYGAHKRHISTAHGKSTKTYDQQIEKELGYR
jgi:cytidine deaminase